MERKFCSKTKLALSRSKLIQELSKLHIQQVPLSSNTMAPFQVLVRAAGGPSTLALNVECTETAAQVVEKYARATGRVYNNFRNVS